jgi:hypothetical protein
MSLEKPGFSAAMPARVSAFSLPGVPSWPLTYIRLTVLVRKSCTIFWMLQAVVCPGLAPVWPALAMALVESEWMVMCCHPCSGPASVNQEMAFSIAANSASKAVCWLPIFRSPSAMVGPSPLSFSVIIQPKPAAFLKEPSVHAWQPSVTRCMLCPWCLEACPGGANFHRASLFD